MNANESSGQDTILDRAPSPSISMINTLLKLSEQFGLVLSLPVDDCFNMITDGQRIMQSWWRNQSHLDAKLKQIKDLGQTRPILIQNETVVDGYATLFAMKQGGMREVYARFGFNARQTKVLLGTPFSSLTRDWRKLSWMAPIAAEHLFDALVIMERLGRIDPTDQTGQAGHDDTAGTTDTTHNSDRPTRSSRSDYIDQIVRMCRVSEALPSDAPEFLVEFARKITRRPMAEVVDL